MGTLFHYDEFHETSDREAKGTEQKRQVEVFTASGTHDINLRIGELGHEHSGQGYSVRLSDDEAKALLVGLKNALSYKGAKI